MTDFDFLILLGTSTLFTFFGTIAVLGHFHLKWSVRNQEKLKQAALDQD